ncbi:MAG: HTH domain-containing protein, partial [Comamonadaceae bacterium]
MRRADRLFHIIQLVRGRRLTTAAWLAQRLEVSERTIYRDVADLQVQGVPLEGEAGVGYRLGAGFDLPPMMFTQDEAKALVASVRISQAWLDPALGQSAQDALGKILSVLPVDARVAAEALAVYAPYAGLPDGAQRTLQTLREAV